MCIIAYLHLHSHESIFYKDLKHYLVLDHAVYLPVFVIVISQIYLFLVLSEQVHAQGAHRLTIPINGVQRINKKLYELRHYFFVFYYEVNIVFVLDLESDALPGIHGAFVFESSNVN